MKKTVKLLTALATAAALILGAGAFVSCSNGSDDDDTPAQAQKPNNGDNTGNGNNKEEVMALTLTIDDDGEITEGGVVIKVTVENADSEALEALSKITVTADKEDVVNFYSDGGCSNEITAEGWTEGLPDLSGGEFSIYVKAEAENTEENVTVTVTLFGEGDSELATGAATFGISED